MVNGSKFSSNSSSTSRPSSFSKEGISSKDLIFETYGDHRMAMCLAPLALKSRSVTLSNPEVVNKSYRDFWNHLKCIGFNVYDI